MPRPYPQRGQRAKTNKNSTRAYADTIRKKARSGAKGSAPIGGAAMGGASG